MQGITLQNFKVNIDDAEFQIGLMNVLLSHEDIKQITIEN